MELAKKATKYMFENSHKVNKTYLAHYLKEISMRVGGGEDIEYAGIKESDEETEAVG